VIMEGHADILKNEKLKLVEVSIIHQSPFSIQANAHVHKTSNQSFIKIATDLKAIPFVSLLIIKLKKVLNLKAVIIFLLKVSQIQFSSSFKKVKLLIIM